MSRLARAIIEGISIWLETMQGQSQGKEKKTINATIRLEPEDWEALGRRN